MDALVGRWRRGEAKLGDGDGEDRGGDGEARRRRGDGEEYGV